MEAVHGGHYLRTLAIQKEDLGCDVLIKPGNKLLLGSMEGHSSIDHYEISFGRLFLPEKKP
jgi:hypothetical protein